MAGTEINADFLDRIRNWIKEYEGQKLIVAPDSELESIGSASIVASHFCKGDNLAIGRKFIERMQTKMPDDNTLTTIGAACVDAAERTSDRKTVGRVLAQKLVIYFDLSPISVSVLEHV